MQLQSSSSGTAANASAITATDSLDSVADSTNAIKIFDSSKASPYAQRRSAHTTPPAVPIIPMTDGIYIVDNHYSAEVADNDGFSLDSVSIESGSISRFTVIN